ncbi:MAG: lipopolysaccharide biosynthesis protein [Cyanobacteria bacterium P01_E01_bin.35]
MLKPIEEKITPKVDNDFFRTDNLKSNLKDRSVRGGAATVGAQGIKFFLQTGTTLALARLLVPEDFGLIGMVTVIINFVQLFKDLGLSTATIQKQQINQEQVTTLFWINLAVSFVITAIVILLSPIIAWFYQEQRLRAIICVLGTIFVFGGLTVQHQALLKRKMHFGSLAKVEIASVFFSVIIALSAASLGLGYWSLVLMQLAQASANAIGVWIACSWRPGLPTKTNEVASLLAFGGNITGYRITNYFSRNLDNILLGQYWGAQQLGLYAMAYKLLLLPIQQINAPITSVALPALSRLQNEPNNYKNYYHKALLLITSVSMPLVAFMFVAIDKIVLIALGEKWLDTIPIFQYLMPAAFIGTFNVVGGWVLISLNRANRLFKLGVATSIVNIIIFLISIRWGAIGVAAAYGFSRIIIVFPILRYTYRGTFLSLKELFITLSRPMLASIGSMVISIVINQYFINDLNAFLGLVVNFVLYTVFYFLIWLILPDGKSTLKNLWSTIKLITHKN